MKLAAHNTLSYLPPKKWWLRPLKFMARCQSKTIEEQYNIYGIRFFDFRVSFNKYGNLIFKHGLFEYKSDKTIFDYLDWLSCQNDRVVVRILLEEFKNNNNEAKFIDLCSTLEEKYPTIKFCGGCYKRGKKIYEFKRYENISYIEIHSSVTTTYGWVDEFFPWVYAKLKNKYNIKRMRDSKEFDYLMIDFVNIQ